jgi:hypothetical protein
VIQKPNRTKIENKKNFMRRPIFLIEKKNFSLPNAYNQKYIVSIYNYKRIPLFIYLKYEKGT